MRFLIKNITGDPLNPNLDLRIPRTLYASVETLSNTMPVAPGETRSISEKAYNELLSNYPQFIEVIDSDGSLDKWAPFRTTRLLDMGVWTFVDLGRVSNYIEVYNDGPSQVKWSCSGFTAPETAPNPEFVSDLDVGEMLSFYQTMDPMRYFYFMAPTDTALVKIFVS